MEKIYRVQMNSSGMPNFATAVEVDTDISDYSDKLWRNAYERGKADRPQGKWIKNNLGTVICSECKRPRRDNRVNHINFCNSCGARMRPELQGKHFDSIIIDESAMKGADDEVTTV